MINENLSPAHVVTFLNELAAIDPLLMRALFDVTKPACDILADHPSVQTNHLTGNNVEVHDQEENYTVGFLGIINGMFGTFDEGPVKGWGPIAIQFDPDDPESVSFSLVNPNATPTPYAG